MQKRKLVLIDLMNLIFRYHYAFAHNPLKAKNGQVTSALFGLSHNIWRLIDTGIVTHLVVVADGGSDRRKSYFEQYKSTRKEMPEEIASQLLLVRELLSAFGVNYIKKIGEEADDVIGTLVAKLSKEDHGADFEVFSSDLDFLQLLSLSKNIGLRLPKRQGDDVVITNENLHTEYPLNASTFIDYLALSGDPSDNIPGVRGVGDKTAISLLQSYGNLEGVFGNLASLSKGVRAKLEAGKDAAFLSRKLASIITDLPDESKMSDFSVSRSQIYNQNLFKMCETLDIRSISSKIAAFQRKGKEGSDPLAEHVRSNDEVSEEDGYGVAASVSTDKNDI